eukprot:m.248483 g.248483  ORF g.248483 m.248483 type:complete len:155 (+) comp22613_c3_seq13:90-554(+)
MASFDCVFIVRAHGPKRPEKNTGSESVKEDVPWQSGQPRSRDSSNRTADPSPPPQSHHQQIHPAERIPSMATPMQQRASLTPHAAKERPASGTATSTPKAPSNSLEKPAAAPSSWHGHSRAERTPDPGPRPMQPTCTSPAARPPACVSTSDYRH